jgi:hypothetical protein
MIVSRLTSVLLGMSAFGGVASAQIESTGFKAVDGWVAGYSICGPEFAATCSYPISNVCVPNDHAASQNCCEGDPNEDTGWHMDELSEHCNEPHIDTANPFSGLQHLRFQRDPAAGDPPGCGVGPMIAQCQNTALTPRLGPQGKEPTVISFEIANSEARSPWPLLRFRAIAEHDSFYQLAAFVAFSAAPPEIMSVADLCAFSQAVAPLMPEGVYGNVTIELDPGANTVRYCYAGNTVLLTKFSPSQARTVQGAIFLASNISGIWDIDDFSVVRSTSASTVCLDFPSECQTKCGPRPCAALKAVAVNGKPIPPTTDVHVRPGDVIETEIHFSGWGGNIPELRLYEAKLRLRDAATSGTNGTLLPLGWDAPLDFVYCARAADCPSAYLICMPLSSGRICVGPNHDPDTGVFIATERPDFALFGLPGFFFVRDFSLNYVFVGVGEESIGNEDDGVPRYAGTLLLRVSDDACGTFTVPLDETLPAVGDYHVTFLGDPHSPPVIADLVSRPLVIHVCAGDGNVCDGVQFCDGACCDPWDGDCQNAVVQADCACPNCV